MPQIVRSLFRHRPRPGQAADQRAPAQHRADHLRLAPLPRAYQRGARAAQAPRSRRAMLAETDPLTGCLNRRSIGAGDRPLLADARRAAKHVAMIMIDLDKFKQINDLNGHSAGDLVLQRTAPSGSPRCCPDARCWPASAATSSPASFRSTAARPRPIDQLAAAMVEASPSRSEVERLVGSRSPSRSASPAATAPAGAGRPHRRRRKPACTWRTSPCTMPRSRAGTATSGSKRRWRASCASAASSKPASAAASPRGEFVPYYEQQIDLETGELAGFEMLARWNSPDARHGRPRNLHPDRRGNRRDRRTVGDA